MRYLSKRELLIVTLWRLRKKNIDVVTESELMSLLGTKAIRIRVWEINKRRPKSIVVITKLVRNKFENSFMLLFEKEREALLSLSINYTQGRKISNFDCRV